MQTKISIEKQLTLVEQQLDTAFDCLNAGHAPALAQASEALQATAVELVQMVQHARGASVTPEFKAKIGDVAQRLIALRENLLRRSAYVDRALKVVLPTAAETGYQSQRAYGSGPRSSGTMTMLSA